MVCWYRIKINQGRSHFLPLQNENFKKNFLLVHGGAIQIQWKENEFFGLNDCFSMKFNANLYAYTFRGKFYLPKIHKNSSLFNRRHSKKC